jgi:signal transduction histidine kinase
MKLLTKINLVVVLFVAIVFLAVFGILVVLGGEVKVLGGILSGGAVILTVTLLFFIDILLQKKVFGPVAEYTRFVKKVSAGDLNQKIEEIVNGDVGKLGEAFNLMMEKLREIDTIKSAFNSVAAHQLRTPLSGMKWVLKYLLDGDAGAMTQEQGEMLKRGYETNEKMIQMVNNLLYVSRIENGKFGYDFKENDFSRFLDALRENSELAFKERGIELDIDNHVPVLAPFVFDFGNLLIALQNIVDNAIKYTPPNGKVRIAVDKEGDLLKITISDNGVGIPETELSKLFSKFFRASNVVRLQTEGTGLGLFITKNIILRHGGTISVDSVEGKGTTFTIRISLSLKKEPLENGI